MGKKFLIATLFSVVIPSVLSVYIFINSGHSICFTDACLKNAVSLYALPIKAVEVSLTALTLFLIYFGFLSTVKSMEMTVRTNTFRDYISHREAFFSLLAQHERGVLVIRNKDLLYRNLFPQNTPMKFSPKPDNGNISTVFTIDSIMNDLRQCIEGMMVSVTKGSCSLRDLAENIEGFLVVSEKLGVSEKEYMTLNSEYAGFAPSSKVPNCLSESIKEVFTLVSSIEGFCKEYVDRHEFSICLENQHEALNFFSKELVEYELPE